MGCTCFSGLLDRVGGTNKPAWRSAWCGLMPVSLAIIFADAAVIGVLLTGTANYATGQSQMTQTFLDYSGTFKYIPILAQACGILATLGVFPQLTSTRLAQVSYYVTALDLLFYYIIFAPTMIALTIFSITYPFSKHSPSTVDGSDPLTLTKALVTLVSIILLLVCARWFVFLHRSLYKILNVGGTGWEFKSDKDIQLEATTGASASLLAPHGAEHGVDRHV